MSVTEFNAALNQVATERGIPVQAVIDSIKLALVSAYKKDRKEHGEDLDALVEPAVEGETTVEGAPETEGEGAGEDEVVELDIVVELDADTGEATIFRDGKDVTPSGFGRIAAQTAKQVILQKIRETEKEVIMEEFEEQIGTIVIANVFKVDSNVVVMDLGKPYAYGVMPQSEQVYSEQYRLNQKIKVLIKEIRETTKGPEIIVSRADPDFIEKLFEQEVPEIASKVVKIEAIAREPGSRTKMAVSSSDEKIDPVGSCVGQKGVRVQSIIAELYGEKIDIIPYSASTERFIAASLSPAMVTEVVLDEEDKKATVSVPEDQQSLAIGKEGQNARLANKLTRWKIDIKGTEGVFADSVTAEGDSKEEAVRGVWDDAIAAATEELKEEAEEKAKEDAEDVEEEGTEEPTETDEASTEEADAKEEKVEEETAKEEEKEEEPAKEEAKDEKEEEVEEKSSEEKEEKDDKEEKIEKKAKDKKPAKKKAKAAKKEKKAKKDEKEKEDTPSEEESN